MSNMGQHLLCARLGSLPSAIAYAGCGFGLMSRFSTGPGRLTKGEATWVQMGRGNVDIDSYVRKLDFSTDKFQHRYRR